MLPNTIFIEKPATPSLNLPLTLISLKNWILIKLTGKDSIPYLHNQFTCDIKNLNINKYTFSSHCNVQGKMITNMYVFYFNKYELAFICPTNVYKKQIEILKKYSIFSKVNIIPDYNVTLLGVAGSNAKQYLSIFFKTLPNQINTIVHHQGISVLYFHLPKERFLLIVHDNSLFYSLLKEAQFLSAQYNNHSQWISLDIESGYPYIDILTSEMFFPQAANIDLLGGISFNKGCYLGQELIARIQHYKLNKQSLHKLTGTIDTNKHNQIPISGNYLMQIQNKTYKKVGTVLQSCQIKGNKLWIQAILLKSIPNNSQLYIQMPQCPDFIFLKKQ
ncbi:tRNA-modifying protein ygfZ [Candidatus Blochmanniella vafra str. BVAF]|uniref:tRNA-modifying protein ygfZ n=1 Tax=Blochmanniella vafra (strain BVAF) TaxID=859654 RepID=E8Q645_BLOVB|nr:tRNA-modifying protein YgfZ [Candidatus Blochmannia vafer]ADV33661.1 tRNA-modifying protein ygfZ [Candidatus Blochmannia vafer str. BVAF]